MTFNYDNFANYTRRPTDPPGPPPKEKPKQEPKKDPPIFNGENKEKQKEPKKEQYFHEDPGEIYFREAEEQIKNNQTDEFN